MDFFFHFIFSFSFPSGPGVRAQAGHGVTHMNTGGFFFTDVTRDRDNENVRSAASGVSQLWHLPHLKRSSIYKYTSLDGRPPQAYTAVSWPLRGWSILDAYYLIQ